MDSQDKYLFNLFRTLDGLLRRCSKDKYHNNNSLNRYRGQGRILAILKLKPEITQKELNYLLGMSRQSLSELLTKMENANYITRTASPDDGRSMIIKITDVGLAQSELIQQEDDAPVDLFNCYSEEEKEQLIAYLEKLVASLQEKLPPIEEHELHHRRRHEDEWGKKTFI